MANTKNYREQGGEKWVIGGEETIVSGGKIAAENGSEIDIESGAALKLAGTTVSATAAEVNALAGAGAVKSDLEKLKNITSSAAELNKLDGAGANVTASNLDALTGGSDVAKATGGHGHLLAAGASDVTASAAELNALQGNVEAVAALVAAGLGVSQAVSQTDHAATPVEVVGGVAGNRICIIAALCTADVVAETTKPTFNLGEEDGAANKFFAEGTLENATAGDVFLSAGILTSAKKMECALTEGVGTTPPPAGAFNFLVLLLPVA